MQFIGRRALLCGGAIMISSAQNFTSAQNVVDHLLLGVSDLDRGIEWLEERTGVRAAPGGIHPGVGTRNALLSLGAGYYLEIIAPDPSQSVYNFQIDVRSRTDPRIVTFAASTKDIETLATTARKAGYKVFGPAAGSRQPPSGKILRWRTLGVLNQLGTGGIEHVPFFIQWDAGSPHPSQSAPAGCQLESLEFQHTNPSDLSGALRTLGMDAKIAQAGAARIIATLQTPKGRVELS